MERKAFELLNQMERSWWYRARARVVATALGRVGVQRVSTVLDFGAGFGGMYPSLKEFGDHIDAFEPDAEADTAARKRGYRNVFSAESDALVPLSYDLIGAFDVVEHIEQDLAFLKRAHVALKPGGYIAITVPAFPFLWSTHDVNHHHFRRYTKASMTTVLNGAGFEVIYKSYWNMFLSVPAGLMRLLGRTGEGALAMPYWLDTIFYMVLTIEDVLMRLLPLPFGTGLVVIARKKA